jgi:hypothetical protein
MHTLQIVSYCCAEAFKLSQTPNDTRTDAVITVVQYVLVTLCAFAATAIAVAYTNLRLLLSLSDEKHRK